MRKAVLEYKPANGGDPNRNNDSSRDPDGGINNNEKDMLYELNLLFKSLSTNKKTKGSFSHLRFMNAIKASNALFDNDEHHDSHEFINWLLDKVHEDFLRNERAKNPAVRNEEEKNSFVADLFKGVLVNIVTCVTCETTTRRQETFFNLSLDIE